ncbi:hypothetical protein OOT46_12185 [Aquabacterium sp. A7-Y]|uniref:hypothetical protein n=1 Tax=Aquabacterium sp. A7-Y TaxID=1349605 RepID=UPI00223DB34F|nr:hypothetical protein [Aquabacterium sp. A7-Y]MCW7538601.1 hypothetical protein [Aquabacterium sp. A7-Y]
MQLGELLTSTSGLGPAAAAVAAALYKAVKALLEFNDEYLRKRRFKQYAYLLGEAEGQAEAQELILMAKREALFRAVLGKPVSQRLGAAVMALYRSGQFSLEELRASLLYATLHEDGTLDVRPGAGGMLVVAISAFFVVGMGAYAGAMVWLLLGQGAWDARMAAVGVLLAYGLLAWWFGRDARAVMLARRVRRRQVALRRAGAPG